MGGGPHASHVKLSFKQVKLLKTFLSFSPNEQTGKSLICKTLLLLRHKRETTFSPPIPTQSQHCPDGNKNHKTLFTICECMNISVSVGFVLRSVPMFVECPLL